MAVIKVTGYATGETSSRYYGSKGTMYTDHGYHYCRNGVNTDTTLSKRTGTEFVTRTPDNKPFKFYNIGHDIMAVLNSGNIFKYLPATNSFQYEGDVKITGVVNSFTYTLATTVPEGTVLYREECGFYLVGKADGVNVPIYPMMGKEKLYKDDNMHKLKSVVITEGIDSVIAAKSGLFVVTSTGSLKEIKQDLTISNLNATGIKGTIKAGTFFQNRLILVTVQGDQTRLQMSQSNNHLSFSGTGSPAGGIELLLSQINPNDVRWVNSVPKGIVIGSLNGIYSFVARNINNVLDATQPIIPEFISPLGAYAAQPAIYRDMLLFVDHSGTDIGVVRQDVYTDSLKCMTATKNFEQPEERGRFIKMVNFSNREQNIMIITDTGNMFLCRPITDQNGNLILGASAWEFGFKGKCNDICRIRREGESDGLVLSINRHMSYYNNYECFELWRPAEEIPRPALDSQIRYERYDEDGTIYNEVLKNIHYRHPYLDCFIRYEPFKNTPKYDLIYDKNNGTLTSDHDMFTPDSVNTVLEIKGHRIFTVMEYINAKQVKVFLKTPEKLEGLYGGVLINNPLGIRKVDYKFLTNLVKCSGPIAMADFEKPVFVLDNKTEVTKFERTKNYGEFKLPIHGHEFVIGIPYDFFYMSNQLTSIAWEGCRRVESLCIRTIFSGAFQVGFPYTTDPKTVNQRTSQTGLIYDYENVVDCSVPSGGRLQGSRFIIRQKNSAPFNMVDLICRLAD